jgi:hypothetical protein
LRIPFGGIFKGTDAAGTNQFKLLEWGVGGVNNNLGIGDGTNTSTIISGGAIALANGATTKLTISGTTISMASVNSLLFASSGVTAPVFGMADDTSNTTTAQPVTYKGQDASGTATVVAGKTIVRGGNATGGSGTRTGGDLELRPGSGATANGELFLADAGSTKRIRINTTGLGFFNAAPVAQPTVTGSRAGNVALGDALTKLASLGLIVDSTTA